MPTTRSPTDNPIQTAPYWICLDSIVDVSRLAAMHEQFCFAAANSIRSVGYADYAADLTHVSGRLREFFSLPEDHPNRLRCAGMDLYKTSLYLGLVHHGKALAEKISITDKRTDARGLKHRSDIWLPTPDNYDKFKFFTDWVDDQQIFEEYGRVFAFMNCPNQLEYPHKDMEELDKPVDFIWLRPSIKPFFVQPYPDSPEKRSYVEGHVIWFNPGMYHGAGLTDYYALSLRVDGVFTKEFRRKIYEHGAQKRV